MTSEFDHEKCRQHVCTACYRYFWTVEKYDVNVTCPYCGENPVHPDRRGESNGFGDTLVVEGEFDDPDKPDGDVYELPNGHRYEMGTRHDCGVRDCPANNLPSEASSEDTETEKTRLDYCDECVGDTLHYRDETDGMWTCGSCGRWSA